MFKEVPVTGQKSSATQAGSLLCVPTMAACRYKLGPITIIPNLNEGHLGGIPLAFHHHLGVTNRGGTFEKKNGPDPIPCHPWDWYSYLHLVVFNGKLW